LGTGGGTRQWEIKGYSNKSTNIKLNISLQIFYFAVTQYKCGDEDNGGKYNIWQWKINLKNACMYKILGPDGCLQYFREPTGVVSR